MKKYYIIYGIIGALFVLMLATLIANNNMIYLIRPSLVRTPLDANSKPTVIGDTLLIIIGIIVIITIVSIIVYKIYKLICRIRRKKDFTADTEELYTTEQSSENISEWLITTSRGYLDEDKNRKK